MYISETPIRVRYAETDQMGVVYHGHYFQYFEVGRVESLRQLGHSYSEIEKGGIIMPVVEVQCRYLRPARYDELLTVVTTLRELPLHHKIEFHQELFNEKKELLASGRVILYFLEAATLERSSMPEELRLTLQPYFS
jgi:acyl-CoA thioester hydrolase